MKRQHTLIASAVIALLASSPLLAGNGPHNGFANGQQAGENGVCTFCANPVEPGSMDSFESATLVFMREEEKAARDIYSASAELWQAPIFANIAESEQRHMDAVASMLTRYGIADPVQVDTAGVFTNMELQALYDELALRSQTSLLEALQVGALVEEVDIEDNELAIAETDNADLARVYGNLLRGSRNHLRAFVREIERLGVVYEAQYLEQSVIDEIVDSPMERGGQGRGPGQGMGKGGLGQGLGQGQEYPNP